MTLKYSIRTLFFIFLNLILSVQVYALSEKNSLTFDFPSIEKTLVVNIQGGACGSVDRPYKITVDQPGKSFRLVCDVKESNITFNSEIPIVLIENFVYPNTILAETSAKSVKEIGVKKYSWGKEYFWNTSYRGSSKYSYICPTKGNYCIRADFGGLEDLRFELKKLKSK